MQIKKVWPYFFGLMTIVLLSGCAPSKSLPAVTVVHPTVTPISPTATSIPVEQAILGAWLHGDEDDVHNWRFHVYTEDGKYCAGSVLAVLLREDAKCYGYEVDGNILTEICTEDSVGCQEGILCTIEIVFLDEKQFEYWVPERCPGYQSLPDDFFNDPKLFKRVENPDEL